MLLHLWSVSYLMPNTPFVRYKSEARLGKTCDTKKSLFLLTAWTCLNLRFVKNQLKSLSCLLYNLRFVLNSHCTTAKILIEKDKSPAEHERSLTIIIPSHFKRWYEECDTHNKGCGLNKVCGPFRKRNIVSFPQKK